VEEDLCRRYSPEQIGVFSLLGGEPRAALSV